MSGWFCQNCVHYHININLQNHAYELYMMLHESGF